MSRGRSYQYEERNIALERMDAWYEKTRMQIRREEEGSTTPKKYFAQVGETLEGIAEKFEVDVNEIIKLSVFLPTLIFTSALFLVFRLFFRAMPKMFLNTK